MHGDLGIWLFYLWYICYSFLRSMSCDVGLGVGGFSMVLTGGFVITCEESAVELGLVR